MPTISVHAGACGFTSRITTTSSDGQTVEISATSPCPHVQEAIDALTTVDAYVEIFSKPHDTVTYKTLCQHIPHTACPVYSAAFKAIEVAAGLALPKQVTVTFEP